MAYRPEPEFESPFKPPPGFDDLIADSEPDSPFPYSETVGNQLFRFRRAQPRSLATFIAAQSEFNSNKEQRLKQLIRFVHHHLHPGDMEKLMVRLIDDDKFGIAELDELTRVITKAGTARPTRPSSPWQRRRLRIGARSGRA